MMAQFIAVVIALEAIVSSARQSAPRRHVGRPELLPRPLDQQALRRGPATASAAPPQPPPTTTAAATTTAHCTFFL